MTNKLEKISCEKLAISKFNTFGGRYYLELNGGTTVLYNIPAFEEIFLKLNQSKYENGQTVKCTLTIEPIN